ncbi:DUF1351 domain-containing protein [Listeria booriae]|uniref:DUF1351 domain-containing protein n=1 Tax=Listeria booriae TaxID=1552123 RepID=A0A842D0T1_9LIST|nr:DUF1351 domain-containing protein [Listeria booriae]MBC2004670.1 DUF1351 domain-containing protein [Listeria booriae]
MTNEVVQTTDEMNFNVKYIPAEIQIRDFDKLHQYVTEYASKYQNLAFTAEDVKDAKAVRSNLNKMSKAIDDRRKEIKREINKPLDDFEEKTKVLINIVNEAVRPIDAGIKEIEAAEKAERQKMINGIIEEIASNYGINSNRIIFDAKWLNKTATEVTIRAAIVEQVEKLAEDDKRMANDIAFIEEYAVKRKIDSTGWIASYKRGSSVTDVISQIDAVEERKRAEEERRRAEEATAKVKAEQQQRYEQGVQQTIEVAAAAPEQSVQEILTEIEESAEPIRVALLELRGTKTQFEALNQYMKEYEIFVKRHKCAGDPQ